MGRSADFGPGTYAADLGSWIAIRDLDIRFRFLLDRLALVMVNEACRCIEEGVVDEPSQLDLAMIMGTGFPPFRGGLLRYADALGARVVHQKLSHLAAVAGENYATTALLAHKAAAGEAFYG